MRSGEPLILPAALWALCRHVLQHQAGRAQIQCHFRETFFSPKLPGPLCVTPRSIPADLLFERACVKINTIE